MKTFPQLLEELYRTRFTGTITLHVFNGVPRRIELPGPTVELIHEKVDKSRKLVEAVSV